VAGKNYVLEMDMRLINRLTLIKLVLSPLYVTLFLILERYENGGVQNY